MRTFLLILLSTFLIIAKAEAQPKHEIRATWLTTLGGMDWPRNKATNASSILKQQQELCAILDQLKEANFNTVMLQTRLRGDLIYPSQIETFPEALTGRTGRNPGYDPLAFAIEECHKRGMELHAWIVTIPAGNNRQVKLLGKHSIVRKNRKICKQHQGAWYLDPGHPETADYLASIVREIVTRYDVDGIHFDYIRYPENARRFPDKDTHRKYGKGKDLKQWRRENITAIARRNSSNYGEYFEKWWVEDQEDLEVQMYIEDSQDYRFSQEKYDEVYRLWGENGLGSIYFPRTTVQSLYHDTMGIEGTVYALADMPDAIEEYFKIKDRVARECIERYEEVTGCNLKDHIEEIVVASPVTWARYLGTPKGDVYGYEPHTWDGMFPRVQSGTENLGYTIKGLRFAGGHGTQMDGYSQAYMSGAEQARYTLHDIKEGK